MRIKRKYKKLLGQKKPFFKRFKSRPKLNIFSRIIEKTGLLIKRVNQMDFGMLFVLFCLFIFFAILIANKIRLESIYVESQEVNNLIADWNTKNASLHYITLINLMLVGQMIILANRRPRKPQVYPERR